MARGVLTIQPSTRVPASTAITFTAADAVNNHSFDNSSGKNLLLIKNDDVGSHDVVIQRAATVDNTALGNQTVSVAAGAVALYGPFPAGIYNQADALNSLTDAVLIDPAATPTAVSLAVISVGSN